MSDAMDVPNQLAESTMALLESRDGCVTGSFMRKTDASSVFWHDCTCKFKHKQKILLRRKSYYIPLYVKSFFSFTTYCTTQKN